MKVFQEDIDNNFKGSKKSNLFYKLGMILNIVLKSMHKTTF